jgi:putative ABC transport system permease protein
MLKNYILISVRNLRKHLTYSLINIFGLGLGLATCLLLVTWIMHELSFDRFHRKAERIYRVSMEYSFGGQVAKPSVSPTALLPALMTIPETETGVRVYNPSKQSPYIVRHENKVFEEQKFYFADSTFFDLFTFRLLHGDAKQVLTEPYAVILTASMAKKYFGNENPVGNSLSINNTRDYKVTGVMEDAPSNSLLQFDFIASFHSLYAAQQEPTWWSANYQTFVLVQPQADVQSLRDKLNDLVREKVSGNVTGDGDYVRYNFTPLTDIYLRSPLDEAEVVSDIQYVYIFAAVAILILVIAGINYINLATARATDRAREVGIRKVVGALRKQLFAQFIGESIVITFAAFGVAFFISQLFLPFFNELTGKNFSYSVLLDPSL